MAPVYQTFVQFLKFIPEFNNIIIDDKIRLLRNHFGVVTNINEYFMFSVIPHNLIMTFTNVFGTDITNGIFKRNKLIDQFIFDPILLKLVLVILVIYNTNNRNLHYIDMKVLYSDSLSIYAAQNVYYVELLWR
ncbi:unnamed protein product [Rotaria socialis]|nr:unnamed protein product [Rotaria socialis]CAF3322653.1 unnamed protein product [Rotaria socialis]CAF3323300.1 unnamed protein product [Rotaria socialis]